MNANFGLKKFECGNFAILGVKFKHGKFASLGAKNLNGMKLEMSDCKTLNSEFSFCVKNNTWEAQFQ